MRQSHEEIEAMFEEVKKRVVIGGVYAHYKHPEQLYRVLDLGWLTGTEEPAVIYKALYGTGITFIRPVKIWLEAVKMHGKYLHRFVLRHG